MRTGPGRCFMRLLICCILLVIERCACGRWRRAMRHRIRARARHRSRMRNPQFGGQRFRCCDRSRRRTGRRRTLCIRYRRWRILPAVPGVRSFRSLRRCSRNCAVASHASILHRREWTGETEIGAGRPDRGRHSRRARGARLGRRPLRTIAAVAVPGTGDPACGARIPGGRALRRRERSTGSPVEGQCRCCKEFSR